MYISEQEVRAVLAEVFLQHLYISLPGPLPRVHF